MGYRFNPPPDWPPAPEGFVPEPGWQPDASWPPVPPGWSLWIDDPVVPGSSLPAAPNALLSYPSDSDVAYLQPKKGTNGFAIASLILGIVGGVLLSVIFGLMALAKIRNRPQGGKGLAIAGLALSCAWVVGIVAVVAIHAAGTAHRSASTGQITASGKLSVFSLRVGDCFQNPSGSQASATVANVSAVPCTTPHNAQAFAQLQAAGTSYPGNSALFRQASNGCNAQVAADLDKSRITGTMKLHFIFPLSQSWADGRRTIMCLVVDSSPDLTSSLLK